MAYIDWAYFKSQHPDSGITAQEFGALAQTASAVIDSVTLHKLKQGLHMYPAAVQTAVKMATCAQVLHIDQGGLDEVWGNVSIGKFSYGGGGSKRVAPLVETYLMPTGLLYMGIC